MSIVHGRREFIAGLAGALISGCSVASQDRRLDRSQAPLEPIWIDAQGSVSDPDPEAADDSPPSIRMLEMLREARLTATSMTMGQPGVGEESLDATLANLGSINGWVAANPSHLMPIRRGGDLAVARDTGRLGLICNLQDSALIGRNAARIADLQSAGVRVMQLTYNLRNQCGSGCLEPDDDGVTPFGRDVVAEIESRRILLDLSHSGPVTTLQAIQMASRPATISHAGCRALVDFPRNVDDGSMRALADRGGVIGIYMMPFLAPRGMATGEDFFRHLDHAVRLCGEDHVGIGTDGSLAPAPSDAEARESHRRRYDARRQRGLAAPGEGPDRLNFVEGYNRTDRFARVAHDLRRMRWGERRIEKILGGNFARLFTEVWGS